MAAEQKHMDVEDACDKTAERTPPSVRDISEEEREARRARIMSCAGSMKGVFADDFIEENYRKRQVPSFRRIDV